MKAILSADLNWGIGYLGNLLLRIPEDMRFFRKTTKGKVVVMGRETFESLPGQEPLKDRVNIVLSRQDYRTNKNITVCHSVDELLKSVGEYNTDDVFVIGGESIYRQLLPLCNEVFVTKFYKAFLADRHFVDLDNESSWQLAEESSSYYFNDMEYRFLKYQKIG